MKKRRTGKCRCIFAVILCLCVLFNTQPEIGNGLSVFAAEKRDTNSPDTEIHTHDDVVFETWSMTDSLPETEGNYCLAGDVALSATWSVPKGTTNLCLNGHTLTGTGNASVIRIPKNVTLNLYDGEDNEGKITGGGVSATSDLYGGGVNVRGTFHMYGGTITGNKSYVTNSDSRGGGGVYVDGGSFTMHNGNIINNRTNRKTNNTSDRGYGGGVDVYNGSFTLMDGIISNNYSDNGGNVNVCPNAIFTMESGTISNGRSFNSNGGVYNAGTFTMKGGKVSDNYGSGVECAVASASDFTMTGGVISDNTMYGVEFNSGTVSVSGDVKVQKVYLGSGRKITIMEPGLTEGASIEIVSAKKPTADAPVDVTGENSTDYSKYFFSGNSAYIIRNFGSGSSQTLQLAVPVICELGGLDLSADGVTLSPSFDAGTTEYTAEAANNVDQIDITATLADMAAGAAIKLKKGNTEDLMTSGVAKTVSLDVGTNTFEIIVTNGDVDKTYTLVITREEYMGPVHNHPVCGASCSHDGTHSSLDWKPLTSTGGELTEGNYYLTGDVALKDCLEIPSGTKINLCLNGHTLNGPGVNAPIQLDGTLTICDCSDGGTGVLCGDSVSGSQNSVVGGAETGILNLYSGKLTGSSTSVVTVRGTFNMFGGTVTGDRYGIYMDNDTAVLNLSGNPTVSGTTADLYLRTASGTILDDARVNAVSYAGGALRVAEHRTTDIEDAYAIKVSDGNKDIFTLTNSGWCYLYKDGGLTLRSLKHIHSYTYEASGAVITESCSCGHEETATLSLQSDADLTYTGSAIKPVTVTYSSGWEGTGIEKPDDTAIAYTNNTDAGTATAKLDISGALASIHFTIVPKPLTDGMMTVASGPHYYTGNAVEPAVTVNDGSTTLTSGTDYTVSYENNTNIGTAKVIVMGKGNYTGSIHKTFTVSYRPLPDGRSLMDYVSISPSPNDNGWYDSDLTLTPENGCRVGDTPAGTGTSFVISEETGTDGDTKTIYIKDRDGNIYQTQFSCRLDKTLPVIDLTDLSVENGSKNLWDWIIGKENMIIKIPAGGITDTFSGIAEVTYTAVPDSGTEQTGTIRAQDGYYVIALNRAFSGTIRLTAEDKAGNTKQTSLTAEAGKVIAEDCAPVVTFTLPDTLTPNEDGWYNRGFDLIVTVTDDKDKAVSAGIASVKYQMGDSEEVIVRQDFVTSMKTSTTFTIPADEIPAGQTEITVTAVDHAGNSVTEKQTVKVMTDADKVAAMKKIVAETLTGYTAVNGTTKEELQEKIETALTNAGISDVTVTVGDLSKTEATTSAEGSIRGNITIKCGNVTDNVAINKTIDKLSVVHTHIWTWVITKAATADEEGEMSGSCTCGERTTAVISKTGEGGSGTVIVKEDEGNECKASLADKEDVKGKVSLTDEEKVHLNTGEDLVIKLRLKDKNAAVDTQEKTEIQNEMGTNTLGTFLDIELLKQIGGTETKITETTDKIEVTFEVPEHIRNTDGTVTRTYQIMRLHNGVVDFLDVESYDEVTHLLTFKTDKFSTYALVYRDTVKPQTAVTGVTLDKGDVTLTKAGETAQLTVHVVPADATNHKVIWNSSDPKVATVDGNGKVTAVGSGTCTVTATTEDGNKTVTCKVTVNMETTDTPKKPEPDTPTQTVLMKNALSLNALLKVSQTGKKINIVWGKVAGADGYDVYIQYCGKKYTKKSITAIKNGRTTKVTVKKVNGKPLNLKKNYKVYILAYKLANGKKVTLGKTITAHIIGRRNVKYTNVKAVKVKKSSYNLKKGKTVKIKAKTVLVSPGRKQLSNAHAKQFRYATSNRKVAKVSKKGKIKAVGKGNCTIYVYARNGYAKKIKVKVK